MLDSLVRVSRRVAGNHYAKHPSPGHESPQHDPQHSVAAAGTAGYNAPQGEPHSTLALTAAQLR